MGDIRSETGTAKWSQKAETWDGRVVMSGWDVLLFAPRTMKGRVFDRAEFEKFFPSALSRLALRQIP